MKTGHSSFPSALATVSSSLKGRDEPCFHLAKKLNKQVTWRHLKFPHHVKTVTNVKRQCFRWEWRTAGKAFSSLACERAWGGNLPAGAVTARTLQTHLSVHRTFSLLRWPLVEHKHIWNAYTTSSTHRGEQAQRHPMSSASERTRLVHWRHFLFCLGLP